MGELAAVLLPAIAPTLPWIGALVVGMGILMWPASGRGPLGRDRDPWRGYKYENRRVVLERAGGRCEAPAFLSWGRCDQAAVEVDHVFPWSKGGPTVASNGQALCKSHNRRKAALTPPWWYVRGLERRRRSYFPDGHDVRVLAR